MLPNCQLVERSLEEQRELVAAGQLHRAAVSPVWVITHAKVQTGQEALTLYAETGDNKGGWRLDGKMKLPLRIASRRGQQPVLVPVKRKAAGVGEEPPDKASAHEA